MSMVDRMTIVIETPRIDSKCSFDIILIWLYLNVCKTVILDKKKININPRDMIGASVINKRESQENTRLFDMI